MNYVQILTNINYKNEIYNYSPSLESHNPKTTAKMPMTILETMYIEKWSSSLFFRRKCFSKANAENVVKPPQNPVAKNKVLL